MLAAGLLLSECAAVALVLAGSPSAFVCGGCVVPGLHTAPECQLFAHPHSYTPAPRTHTSMQPQHNHRHDDTIAYLEAQLGQNARSRPTCKVQVHIQLQRQGNCATVRLEMPTRRVLCCSKQWWHCTHITCRQWTSGRQDSQDWVRMAVAGIQTVVIASVGFESI